MIRREQDQNAAAMAIRFIDARYRLRLNDAKPCA
jgi:hypothetical protein